MPDRRRRDCVVFRYKKALRTQEDNDLYLRRSRLDSPNSKQEIPIHIHTYHPRSPTQSYPPFLQTIVPKQNAPPRSLPSKQSTSSQSQHIPYPKTPMPAFLPSFLPSLLPCFHSSFRAGASPAQSSSAPLTHLFTGTIPRTDDGDEKPLNRIEVYGPRRR